MREDYLCPICKNVLNNDDWTHQESDDFIINNSTCYKLYFQKCPYCNHDILLTQEYSLILEDEYVKEDDHAIL